MRCGTIFSGFLHLHLIVWFFYYMHLRLHLLRSVLAQWNVVQCGSFDFVGKAYTPRCSTPHVCYFNISHLVLGHILIDVTWCTSLCFKHSSLYSLLYAFMHCFSHFLFTPVFSVHIYIVYKTTRAQKIILWNTICFLSS